MRTLPRRLFNVAVSILALTALPMLATTTAQATATSVDASAKSFVPASDARVIYEGRFDRSDPADPAVIWQASRIRLDFTGDSIALRFGEATGQNVFNAEIDGRATVVTIKEGAAPHDAVLSSLGAGRHHLMVFKRTEAAAGTVHFRGVALATGGEAFAPEPPHYATAMLFIGDSITAAACNEDGEADQWEDRRTHNNALSYGAFTAAAFNADYRNIAVSGMGVVTGWVPMKAGEIWDRVYPRTDSAPARLSQWTPAVVFVNLGENDDSYTSAKKLPFPSEAYTNGYVELAQAIRRAYPKAELVVLRGGMFGGAQSERLRGPWEAAVRHIEAADSHATHFVFTHWSHTHPRVADHRAMADELIAWLKSQPFIHARD